MNVERSPMWRNVIIDNIHPTTSIKSYSFYRIQQQQKKYENITKNKMNNDTLTTMSFNMFNVHDFEFGK